MKSKHVPIIIGLVVLIAVVVIAAVIMGGKSKDDTSMSNMNNANTSNTSGSGSNSNASNSDTVATDKVDIKNYAFSPMSIKVKVGTTVTWTNQDSVHHTVTVDEGEGPKSDSFGKGETYTYKFTKAGTFTYHCEPHPYMHGTVVVTE